MRSIKPVATTSPRLKQGALALALLCGALGAAQAVTVSIVNANAPGVGFNDSTPAAPVGGNGGTTLGQQRLIAFTHAANIWGAKLTSAVPIRIRATFEPLTCTASSAVLGSAGAWDVFSDFPGAPRPNTWYPAALAGKLAGVDQSSPDEPHIRARFNSRLGLAADCLPGSGFYLGIDNQHGDKIDFVTVLLHEMGHGLGFQTFTDDETGEFYANQPSAWDHYLTDNRSEKTWAIADAEERAASAVSGDGLSWNGPHVKSLVADVLSPVSRLTIAGPAAGAAAGEYAVGDAAFGPGLAEPALSASVMPVVDQANGTGLACAPLSAANALAVKNNIALVDRGACTFAIKVKNAQNAGAKGVIVVDNAPGTVTGLGGSDASVVIPAVRVTQADGNALRASLQKRSRTSSGVTASLGLNPLRKAGTDQANRILMYTPLILEPGSSVSHYSTAAKRNQLMEPAISGDLSHEVEAPLDLTLPLLRDIGW